MKSHVLPSIAVSFLAILIFSYIPVSYSQDNQGRNANAIFALDFSTTAEDSLTSTTLEQTPQIQDNQFTVTLVLMGSTDLVGVNCDLDFDESVLQVVDIHEASGDVNFDGRENIADVLTLTERFNASVDQNGFSFFNFANTGDSADVIDMDDVNSLIPLIESNDSLFWTNNPDFEVTLPIRESVEIFEDPAISNQNGLIDDIVTVLLPRQHPEQGFVEGFGFDGDARIAEITFQIIDESATETTIQFSDVLAIDEGTIITTTEINNASQPQADPIVVPLQ